MDSRRKERLALVITWITLSLSLCKFSCDHVTQTVPSFKHCLNSDAMALGESLEECTVEATSSECIEYGAKLEELASLIAQTAPQVNRVKTLAADIKAIKLMAIDMPTGADSPAIRSALAAAKAATAVFGPTSSQAALAWEELEEIASAFEIAGALGGKLDDECLLDMMEACQALEELDRALGSN